MFSTQPIPKHFVLYEPPCHGWPEEPPYERPGAVTMLAASVAGLGATVTLALLFGRAVWDVIQTLVWGRAL